MKCTHCQSEEFETVMNTMYALVDGFEYEADGFAQQCSTCLSRRVAGDHLEQFEDNIVRVIAKTLRVGPNAFKRLQSAAGVKGIELAAWLEVTPASVSRWATGLNSVPIPVFVVLAELASERLVGRCYLRDSLVARCKRVEAQDD